MVIAETARPPADFVGRAMQKGTHRVEELLYWNRLFRELKVRYLELRHEWALDHPALGHSRTDKVHMRLELPATAGAPADWALTWSASAAGAAPGGALCASRRRFMIRLRGPHDERLRSARVYVDGRRVRTLRRMRAVIDLRRRPRSAVTVRIVGRTRSGRRVIAVRRYHLCVARRRHRGQGQGQGQSG